MGKHKEKANELSYTIEAQDDEIQYLKDEIKGLKNVVDYYVNKELRQAPEIPVTKKAPLFKIKNERWWNFSIELWPPAWGRSYYRFNWQKANSNTREGQIQLGPFGFSWNREPKR